MTRFFTTMLLLVLTLPAIARVNVITSSDKNETQYIKITDDSIHVSFQLCDRVTKSCEQIGPKPKYIKKHIINRRLIEYGRMTAVGALDAGLAVLAFYGGARAVAALTSSSPILIIQLFKMGAGGVAAATLSQVGTWATIMLNPLTYYRRSRAAGKAMNGKNSSNDDILKFRDQLEDLLRLVD